MPMAREQKVEVFDIRRNVEQRLIRSDQHFDVFDSYMRKVQTVEMSPALSSSLVDSRV